MPEKQSLEARLRRLLIFAEAMAVAAEANGSNCAALLDDVAVVRRSLDDRTHSLPATLEEGTDGKFHPQSWVLIDGQKVDAFDDLPKPLTIVDVCVGHRVRATSENAYAVVDHEIPIGALGTVLKVVTRKHLPPLIYVKFDDSSQDHFTCYPHELELAL